MTLKSDFQSPKRRIRDVILIGAISSGITALLVLVLLPRLISYLRQFSAIELLTAAGVVVAAVGVTWQIIRFRLSASPKLKAHLDVTAYAGHAVISATITNIGKRRITPLNAYVFVDRARDVDEGIFEFPFLLKHEGGHIDCNFGKAMQGALREHCGDIQGSIHGVHSSAASLISIHTLYRPG
ncbi:hypothetical protein ACFLS5_02785 [Candidatus Bipolaricaulota bacterium]